MAELAIIMLYVAYCVFANDCYLMYCLLYLILTVEKKNEQGETNQYAATKVD